MNYATQKGQGSSVRMRLTLVHCSTGQELQRKVSLNKLRLLVSVNSVCAGAVESKCTASLGKCVMMFSLGTYCLLHISLDWTVMLCRHWLWAQLLCLAVLRCVKRLLVKLWLLLWLNLCCCGCLTPASWAQFCYQRKSHCAVQNLTPLWFYQV